VFNLLNLYYMMSKLSLFLSLLLIGMFFYSCSSKETISVNPQNEEQKFLFSALKLAGFDEKKLEICGDHLIVDKDVFIGYNLILDWAKAISNETYLDGGTVERQHIAGTSFVISRSIVQNQLKVFIDPSLQNITGGDLTPTIITALNLWSANTTLARLNFVIVATHAEAQITFFRDDVASNLNPTPPPCFTPLAAIGLIGRAFFPENGLPGRFIAFSSTIFPTGNSQRLAVILHEIGHAVGFRHNDTSNEGTGNVPCQGVTLGDDLLYGLPNSDNNSVMKNPATKTSLSDDDGRAARFLYPIQYVTPTIVSVGPRPNGIAGMQVVINPVGPMYFKAIVEVSKPDGTIVSTIHIPGISSNGNPNFTYPFSKPTISGTYRVRVRGRNYKNDFQSDWSSFSNFTI
jgi:Zn-dependent protease with chaperone function